MESRDSRISGPVISFSAKSGSSEIHNIIHKLKNIVDGMVEKDQRLSTRSVIIETDFEREDKIDSHIPGTNCYGTFEDIAEFKECQDLTKRIENALRIAREDTLQCEILIPRGLISRIAQDILRMSHSEPCGLRGCLLYIDLEEKNSRKRLVKLPSSTSTVATFELYLTLKEDTRHWCTVKKLMLTVSGCFKNSTWRSTPKILCSGFQLEKKKLYRHAKC